MDRQHTKPAINPESWEILPTQPEGNFKVVGFDSGWLVFEAENGYRYVSGETLSDFGVANLTYAERIVLGV